MNLIQNIWQTSRISLIQVLFTLLVELQNDCYNYNSIGLRSIDGLMQQLLR